jgi:hypothetical protein
MSDEKLPASVLEFISQHLASVEEVEILRFLATTSTLEWTAHDAYAVVLSTVTSIGRVLEKFAAAGLIERVRTEPPTYRSRLSGEMNAVVTDVCKYYRIMPVRVIEAIYKKETSSIEEFAKAFKFKRET